ncbi:MAG: hypothetical protein JST91_18715 [Actinobacteria bacterium]|nr:hypothetical protein [Actinomycetota bacterium]
MAEDFPLERNTTLGQFWLPGAEEKVVTGLLRIVESDIHVEVSPGLVPMHTFEQMGPGQWSIRATDDPPDMVVLGSIPVSPGRVTIWDVAAATTQANMGVPASARFPLGPSWCPPAKDCRRRLPERRHGVGGRHNGSAVVESNHGAREFAVAPQLTLATSGGGFR